jgi:signal transduction histidine kinase
MARGFGQTPLDSITQKIEGEKNLTKKATLQLERALLFSRGEKEKATRDIEEALDFFIKSNQSEGQVDSYIVYGNHYFQNRDPQAAAHFDSLAISLAQRIGYKKGLSTAKGNLGREFINLGDLIAAENYLSQAVAEEAQLKLQDPERQAELHNRLSILFARRGDHLKSLEFIELALQFAHGSKDHTLLSNIYINYANALSRLSRFDEAVKMHFKVIRLCEKTKDTLGLQKAYNNLGIAFRNGGEFDKAITYYRKSFALGKKSNDYKTMGLSVVNMATVYSEKQEFEGMDTLYQQGISYFEKAADLGGVAFASHNYGNFLVIQKKYAEADKLLQKAYELRKKLGADLMAASSLSVLGKSAMEQKKWKEAEAYLLAAEPIYQGKNREDRNLKELNGYLKDLYSQLGNYEKAFHYQTQELELEKTLFTENEKVNSLKIEAAYEMEKQAMEMALQREKEALARQRILFVSSGIVLVLLLVLVFLWLRRKQLKERHRAQLINMDQKHRLALSKSLKKAEQQERKKIAHKLHDEAGSMLSVAILNLKQLRSDVLKTDAKADEKLKTTEKILTSLSESVRNISHSLMPVALEKYGLKAAIHDLVKSVNTSQSLKIEEIWEGLDDTGQWSEEFCLTLYRIVQEAINNIIKHAQATNVLLQIVELETSVSIYIEDNGKGLDHKETKEGMGLKLLRSNVAYLNGTIEINGNPNQGTFIIAELPIEKIKEKAPMHSQT